MAQVRGRVVAQLIASFRSSSANKASRRSATIRTQLSNTASGLMSPRSTAASSSICGSANVGQSAGGSASSSAIRSRDGTIAAAFAPSAAWSAFRTAPPVSHRRSIQSPSSLPGYAVYDIRLHRTECLSMRTRARLRQPHRGEAPDGLFPFPSRRRANCVSGAFQQTTRSVGRAPLRPVADNIRCELGCSPRTGCSGKGANGVRGHENS